MWSWDDAFRIVCGEMGIAPSEFYALQYCELRLMLDGYAARVKRERRDRHELDAWMVHWLLLPHQKPDAEPISIDTLLERKPRAKRSGRFASEEDAARAFVAAYKAESEKQKG